VRITGSGDAIAADDNVIAQVLSVGWDGAEQLNTWDTGLIAAGTEEQPSDQLGSAVRAELTGASVGSQVVVIENEQDGQARVLVVDIVGVN
jgi:hypothetical protein